MVKVPLALGALLLAGLGFAAPATANVPGCEYQHPGLADTYDTLTLCILDRQHTGTPASHTDFFRPAGVTYLGYGPGESNTLAAHAYQFSTYSCNACGDQPVTSDHTVVSLNAARQSGSDRTSANVVFIQSEGHSSSLDYTITRLEASYTAGGQGGRIFVYQFERNGACQEWAYYYPAGSPPMVLVPPQSCPAKLPMVPVVAADLPAL